jgi:hypothetical protein
MPAFVPYVEAVTHGAMIDDKPAVVLKAGGVAERGIVVVVAKLTQAGMCDKTHT